MNHALLYRTQSEHIDDKIKMRKLWTRDEIVPQKIPNENINIKFASLFAKNSRKSYYGLRMRKHGLITDYGWENTSVYSASLCIPIELIKKTWMANNKSFYNMTQDYGLGTG